MKGYPVFLVGMEKRRCVVIGGGQIAEGKVAGLLEVDAHVTLISPTLTDALRQWVDDGRVTWIKRTYQPGDLHGAALVIAATDDTNVNAQVWEEASDHALVNVVDDVEHCNFIAGSVVRQGPLTVAISTGGAAPVLAVRLRERLERELGPEYGAFLTLMAELREPLARLYPDFNERRAVWYALVDSDILDLLRAGDTDQALRRITEIAGEAVLAAEESR